MGTKRQIVQFNKEKKLSSGSSIIQDSARLFLYRWKDTVPNLWNEPEYVNLAWGNGSFKTEKEKEEFLQNQIKERFPLEAK